MKKTNAMRMLDKHNITYEVYEYEVDENDLSGVHAAALLDVSEEVMFKTLVAVSDKKEYFVFCIPVKEELDLKKCAKCTHQKRIEMNPLKDLLKISGYQRGGCSPIGMKKKYLTYIDESALLFEKIYISGGERGLSLLIATEDLIHYLDMKCVDLCK